MKDVVIPPVPEEDKAGLEKSLINAETEHTHHFVDQGHHHEPHHSRLEFHSDSHKPEPQHEFEISEKFLRITCTLALIVFLLMIVILSISLQEDPFTITLGLLPVLLTILVTYIIVDQYHMESGFLMVFPFIFTGILMVLIMAFFPDRFENYGSVFFANIVIGVFFEAVLVLQHAFVGKHHGRQPKAHHTPALQAAAPALEASPEIVVVKEQEEPKTQVIVLENEEGVNKFVSNIEDKAKAINAAIGRVYSVRRGGTESMRKKIRVDPTHYNEFNELKDKESAKRRKAAIALLSKIKGTLYLLNQREVDVFDREDLTGLLNITREPYGHDRIIDVLAKNDSDPVKSYHESALQFCEEALKELEGFAEPEVVDTTLSKTKFPLEPHVRKVLGEKLKRVRAKSRKRKPSKHSHQTKLA